MAGQGRIGWSVDGRFATPNPPVAIFWSAGRSYLVSCRLAIRRENQNAVKAVIGGYLPAM